jgi:hypothetical protein
MKTQDINIENKANGKIVAGIIIAVAGCMLLLDQLNFFVPQWLFSWPMWMIAYGVYMGAKYNFKKPIWIWVMVLGTAFLLIDNVNDADRLVWPVGIIGVGAWMVLKHNNKQKEAAHAAGNDTLVK